MKMKQSRQARGYPPILQQQSQQPTAGAMVPVLQQGAIAQPPPAFIRLRKLQRQSAIECPRCQKLLLPNAIFCAGCGLPIYGAPCPGCSTFLGYFKDQMNFRDHMKNREFFWCPTCGIQLGWRQTRGGPAYLVAL